MTYRNSTWHEATAGLWRNNLALVQLLGLCPLLAVTTSVIKGLALGVATLAVGVVTSAAMAVSQARKRRWVRSTVRTG